MTALEFAGYLLMNFTIGAVGGLVSSVLLQLWSDR